MLEDFVNVLTNALKSMTQSTCESDHQETEAMVYSLNSLKFFNHLVETLNPTSKLFDQVIRALGYISVFKLRSIHVDPLIKSGLLSSVYSFFHVPSKVNGDV